MSERSLSALYRAEVRRGAAAGVGVDDLLALDGCVAGEPAGEALDRLAATPDALAVYGIARASSAWSTSIAEDMRRTRAAGPVRTARQRAVAWVSLAAAAGLALFALGLRQPAGTGAPLHGNDQASTAAPQSGDGDTLFADPDSAMVAATSRPAADSIFTDSLDDPSTPRDS